MTDEVHETSGSADGNYLKIGIVAVIAVAILTGITVFAYQYAKKRSSTTVLPGGTTYLGPGNDQKNTPAPVAETKFSISSTTPWITYDGKKFKYSFSYPNTLPIVVFPNDVTDSVAVSWNNIPPQNNILVRVIDIRTTEPKMVQYIGQPETYVKNWWKQWSGLKGVKDVTQFVNAKGMTGYKAHFINNADQTPNEDVFFVVPGNSELMVRFGNGPLEQSVFDRIIDSFSWSASAAATSPAASEETPSAVANPPAANETPAQ